MIATDVKEEARARAESDGAVTIGAGSWIGTGALILPGTTIGEHVTVAGGSVVRGDIPARSVVAGVPARVVRRWSDGAWDPPLPERSNVTTTEEPGELGLRTLLLVPSQRHPRETLSPKC